MVDITYAWWMPIRSGTFFYCCCTSGCVDFLRGRSAFKSSISRFISPNCCWSLFLLCSASFSTASNCIFTIKCLVKTESAGNFSHKGVLRSTASFINYSLYSIWYLSCSRGFFLFFLSATDNFALSILLISCSTARSYRVVTAIKPFISSIVSFS